MLAIAQLLLLIIYECVLASFFKAFRRMKRKKKAIYLALALMPLALMTMFHGAGVGNDTGVYIEYYTSMNHVSISEALKNTRFEKGYILFNWFLNKISDEPQTLFACTGLFLYCSLGRWINKWIDAPGLYICLLVEMLTIDNWMSAQRETIAIAILLFAFDYLVERKFAGFVVLILIAMQIHTLSLALLPAYPAVYFMKDEESQGFITRHSFEIIVIAFSVLLSICFSWILSVLLKGFPKYAYYISGNSGYMDGKPRVAVILKLIVYAMMIVTPRMIKPHALRQDPLYQTLYRLALINIVFVIIALRATIFMRFVGLFSLFAVFDFTNNIARFECFNRRVATLIIIVAFAVYACIITVARTPEWQTTYPFQWCFL